MKKPESLKQEGGYVLAILLVTVTFLAITITYVTSLSLNVYSLAQRDIYKANAQMTADAALDVALTTLNTTGISAYSSTYTPETTLLTDGNQTTTYQIKLLDGATPEKKTVSVISRAKVSGTTRVTRQYELDVSAVTSGFGPASVVSGVGGLVLNNNAKITGGDVVVNGKILVNNNAQIGLSTNPVNVRAAHVACPTVVDSTYPQPCTSGQPIVANGPIYGNVQGQGQTVGTNMSNPGLSGSTVAPIAVPGYGRPAHKAAVTSTVSSATSPIPCSGGTATWPANIKITGNVSITNNCVVTIQGNVWVTGNLTVGNNASLKVSDALGTTRPVVMIDGNVGMTFSNNAKIVQNSVGTGAEVITTWWNTNTATNGGFTCGGIADPLDCTAVTGLALSTSQSVTTINYSNNALAPATVFRSLWSRVSISNNGALGAVAGQTILLGNNAVINFTTSILGSSSLITTWAKRGYIRVYQ
jgi:hypothetical protein